MICGLVYILPRSLRSVAGAPRTARKKNPATPVGMTDQEKANPRAQAGVPVPQEGPPRKAAATGNKDKRLGIGDFTEDGGAMGAGGGGEVGGAVVEGFVGEEGEGVGFFGLFGDAEFLGGEEFDGG